MENPHTLGIRSVMSNNRSTINIYYLIASVRKDLGTYLDSFG